MEVSVENAGGLQRRLKVQIPAERVEQAVEQKLKQVGQHAKVPGFRPGKVPMKVLSQRFGDSARGEVASELVETSYPEALKKVELKPAGRPQVELGDYKPGQDLEFTATFDVFPEVELQGLDSIKVEQPVTEVTEDDIDITIQRAREQNQDFAEVEREARDGDRGVIDFVGKIDGEEFSGGTGSDIKIDLGKEQFLPDIERAVVGRKAGEQFEVTVNFPEDYGAEDLAGKAAQFDVTVKSVNEARLPEIDDEFLKKMRIEEGGEPALRAKIKQSLEGEVKNAIDTRIKTQVMDGLYAANPLEVPQSMVAQEIERMRAETVARMPEEFRDDMEKARELLPDDQLQEPATRRVALGLLLAEVISVHEIKLDRDQVSAKLDELAAGYEQSEQVKQYYQSNPQMMQGLEATVMEDQVVESLLKHAQVKEKNIPLADLMREGGRPG